MTPDYDEAMEVATFLDVIGAFAKATLIRQLCELIPQVPRVPISRTKQPEAPPTALWCEQCQRMIRDGERDRCASRFCSLRKRA